MRLVRRFWPTRSGKSATVMDSHIVIFKKSALVVAVQHAETKLHDIADSDGMTDPYTPGIWGRRPIIAGRVGNRTRCWVVRANLKLSPKLRCE